MIEVYVTFYRYLKTQALKDSNTWETLIGVGLIVQAIGIVVGTLLMLLSLLMDGTGKPGLLGVLIFLCGGISLSVGNHIRKLRGDPLE